MFLKKYFPDVVEEHGLSLTESDSLHVRELVILIQFLVTAHIFQPAFAVVSDFKGIGLIICKINQTVNPVSHCLIFKGHRVTLKSCPRMIIRN